MSMPIAVGTNRPKLLQEGQSPPPDPPEDELGGSASEPIAFTPYWNEDRAARVAAHCAKALSQLYGPDFKMDREEADMLGPPLSAVLNDWVPLAGAAGDSKLANLLALAGVLVLLVVLRLPAVLEAHGWMPEWAWVSRQRRKEERRGAEGREERAAVTAHAPPGSSPGPAPSSPQPAAPVVDQVGDAAKDRRKFEPVLVGGTEYARVEA
jgi:hypothetical protein